MRKARFFLGSIVFLLSASALADSPDHDKAVALFDEARKLIDEGSCDAAMPKLEQSVRYEASVGARLSMADCLESHDPLAAWTQLREAQRLAYLKHDDRTKVAQDRATALESRLPIVHFVIPPAALQEPGLEVRVDGTLVDSFFYADGMIAMKAGPHTIEVTTPNRRWSQQVVAQAGATTAVNVRLAASCPVPTAPVVRHEAPRDPGAAQRTIGLIIGGIGVASLGVGGIFGGAALAKRSDIDSACGGSASACTAPPGSLDSQRSEQQTYAHLSTLGFVVGGVALASGVILFLTAPHAKAPAYVTGAFGPSGASVSLVGRF